MRDDKRLFNRRPPHLGFGRPASAGFTGYGWAYRQSASYLADVLQKNRVNRQLLNLPAAFLYRHAIEVTLKGILIEYGVMGVEKDGGRVQKAAKESLEGP